MNAIFFTLIITLSFFQTFAYFIFEPTPKSKKYKIAAKALRH